MTECHVENLRSQFTGVSASRQKTSTNRSMDGCENVDEVSNPREAQARLGRSSWITSLANPGCQIWRARVPVIGSNHGALAVPLYHYHRRTVLVVCLAFMHAPGPADRACPAQLPPRLPGQGRVHAHPGTTSRKQIDDASLCSAAMRWSESSPRGKAGQPASAINGRVNSPKRDEKSLGAACACRIHLPIDPDRFSRAAARGEKTTR